MAPTDDDKKNQDTSSASDNPFIKFRQYADAQIGALLQGIIGLPSAFSKSDHPRWTDFEEDPRRKTTAQEPVKCSNSNDSNARKAQSENEVAVPVKKSAEWGPSRENCHTASNRPGNHERDNDGQRDMPLYSAVIRPLFSHLRKTTEQDNIDWNQPKTGIFDRTEDTPESLPAGWEIKVTPFGLQYYFDHNTQSISWIPETPFMYTLRPDQKPTNYPTTLQYTVFNTLNKTARDPFLFWGPVSLHSRSSVLPYLLFSHYSPLYLNQTPQEPSYRDAFEDLMLQHNGQPMVLRGDENQGHQIAENRLKKDLAWIYKLGFWGILSETPSMRDIFEDISRELFRKDLVEEVRNVFEPKSEAKDPNSEQEMYDRFLRSASSPDATSAGMFDTLLNDTERFVKQQIAGLEKQDAKVDHETLAKNAEPKSAEKSTKTAETPDRLVSTSTSSERTTHEDGTVETILIVRKRFADGRETVTETSHTEMSRGDASNTNTNGTGSSQEPSQKDGDIKKGWFWN